MNPTKILVDLPSELLSKCLSYLPYAQISVTREVCHIMDYECKMLLNSGFVTACKIHEPMYYSSSLEFGYELEFHPMDPYTRSRQELDDCRIPVLKLTYEKYIERNACCFIPGKVLDDLFIVLYLIKGISDMFDNNVGFDIQVMPYECLQLQELNRSSSKAIGHFKKNIEPSLSKFPRPFRPAPFISVDVLTQRCGEFDLFDFNAMITFQKQELDRMKLCLKSHKLPQNMDDLMKCQKYAQKTSQALSSLSQEYLDVSHEILELGKKIDVQTQDKKMNRKPSKDEEMENIQ